jgi:predicted metalloprotease with PDZ domain
MFLRSGPILAALAFLVGAAPAPKPIDWQIVPVLEEGHVTHIDFSLTFSGDEDGETVMNLPDQWGGQRELYRGLRDFSASGASLEPGTDAAQLVLRHAPGATVTLIWTLGGGSDTPPAKRGGNDYRARFEPDYFFFIGYTALPWPEHVSDTAPARVRLEPPQGLHIVSDLQHDPDGHTRFSALGQSAMLGGDIRIIDAGGGARLGLVGTFDTVDDAYWQDTFSRISRAERAYWKSKDAPFLVTVIAEQMAPEVYSIGGTGLGDAFSIFASANIDGKDVAPLLAHEMMHSWIPHRIGRMPEENEARQYWLSEGFTEWASFRILVLEGIWSAADFEDAFNKSAKALDLSPVRDADAEAIADGFWSNPDMSRLPYQKGMLIASWLDGKIREKTKGKHDLDDVLLHMQKTAAKDDQAGIYDLLVRSVKKISGWDPSADLETVAMNGSPVSLPEDLFAPCGSISTEEQAVWERGFDFAATRAAGWKVQGVNEGSAAWEAGLRNGMELRAWSENQDERDPMQEKTAQVVDGDGLRAITWRPMGRKTRPVRSLEIATGLSGKDEVACFQRLSGL